MSLTREPTLDQLWRRDRASNAIKDVRRDDQFEAPNYIIGGPEDPKKWSNDEERRFRRPPPPPEVIGRDTADEALHAVCLSDYMLWRDATTEAELRSRIERFARGLLAFPATTDLVQLWVAKPLREREKLALVALTAVHERHDLWDTRASMPEITLSGLARGPALFRLLAGLLRCGVSLSSGGDLVEIVIRHDLLLELAQFLCWLIFHRAGYTREKFVRNLFSEFHGECQQPPNPPTMPDPGREFERSLSGRDRFEVEMLRVFAEEKKPEQCQACCSEKGKGKKKSFFYCSKCLPLKRRVAYCSRDCQVVHHHQHKRFCGAALADVLPTPQFKPAPPLRASDFGRLLQLELCRRTPRQLYHFSSPRVRALLPSLQLPNTPHSEALWRSCLTRLEALVNAPGGRVNLDTLAGYLSSVALAYGSGLSKEDRMTVYRALLWQMARDFHVKPAGLHSPAGERRRLQAAQEKGAKEKGAKVEEEAKEKAAQ
ncbi:hypothetical protein JCM10213_005756 [Rhodosporidiobolus nylandii]